MVCWLTAVILCWMLVQYSHKHWFSLICFCVRTLRPKHHKLTVANFCTSIFLFPLLECCQKAGLDDILLCDSFFLFGKHKLISVWPSHFVQPRMMWHRSVFFCHMGSGWALNTSMCFVTNTHILADDPLHFLLLGDICSKFPEEEFSSVLTVRVLCLVLLSFL